jgi:hypothetical protein
MSRPWAFEVQRSLRPVHGVTDVHESPYELKNNDLRA